MYNKTDHNAFLKSHNESINVNCFGVVLNLIYFMILIIIFLNVTKYYLMLLNSDDISVWGGD